MSQEVFSAVFNTTVSFVCKHMINMDKPNVKN